MRTPSVFDLVRYFFVLGATGFGGPVVLANTMRRELVDQKNWLDEDAYDRGLAIATACPGPMAYQLGVYFGFVTNGVRGALAVAAAFALPPFVIVVAIAALYEQFAGSGITRGLFYGVGPVIVALILRATLALGRKTLKRDVAAWAVAAVACAITIALQRELIWLFLGSGVLGLFIFARRIARSQAPDTPLPMNVRAFPGPILFALVAPATGFAPALFWFFLKTGFLVFGSGLVVVSFVKTYVVDQYHWLDNQTFLDAVAIGMISPGPVVITATFIGYAVDGFAGAVGATLGIFLPSIILTLVATPLLLRYGAHPRVAGFVRGVTVAVVGVLAGTTYLIGRPVITDGVGLALLVIVFGAPFVFKKIPDHAYIALGAIAGLALRSS